MAEEITGLKELEALIQRVRDSPKFVYEAAPEAAYKTRDQLRTTIAAGADPWGQAWEPKKQGHGKPLAHAGGAVHVAAVGTKILIRLTGIETRHHQGWAKGGTERRVIPTLDRPLPDAITRAIFRTITEHFTSYLTD